MLRRRRVDFFHLGSGRYPVRHRVSQLAVSRRLSSFNCDFCQPRAQTTLATSEVHDDQGGQIFRKTHSRDYPFCVTVPLCGLEKVSVQRHVEQNDIGGILHSASQGTRWMTSRVIHCAHAQPHHSKLCCHGFHCSFCIAQGCVAERRCCLAHQHVWRLSSLPDWTAHRPRITFSHAQLLHRLVFTCCQSVQSHIDPMHLHGSSHEAHCLRFAQKHSHLILIAQCRTP